jgi:hypothetical protein
LPAWARWRAVAHATEVLPTPPLPVKNRKRGGLSRNFITRSPVSNIPSRRMPHQASRSTRGG